MSVHDPSDVTDAGVQHSGSDQLREGIGASLRRGGRFMERSPGRAIPDTANASAK
jgi:hypothetical protein